MPTIKFSQLSRRHFEGILRIFRWSTVELVAGWKWWAHKNANHLLIKSASSAVDVAASVNDRTPAGENPEKVRDR